MSGNGPSIGVHQDTHRELIRIQAELMVAKGGQVSMDGVIRQLVADRLLLASMLRGVKNE